MRLLLVSDLHYRIRQLDWLLAAARDPELRPDAVVIAGDLLDIRSAVPIEAQALAVASHLEALSGLVRVLVASGNHDLDGRDAHGEKAAVWLERLRIPGVHVDGGRLEVGGTLITICPWWDGPLARARLEELLEADHAREKERWVWVHHAPPAGSPLCWDGRRAWGDEVLSAWIEQFRPDVVLTGHIHQAPFVPDGGWTHNIDGTWVFNAGHQPGPVPTFVIVDLDEREASWCSATDRLVVPL